MMDRLAYGRRPPMGRSMPHGGRPTHLHPSNVNQPSRISPPSLPSSPISPSSPTRWYPSNPGSVDDMHTLYTARRRLALENNLNDASKPEPVKIVEEKLVNSVIEIAVKSVRIQGRWHRVATGYPDGSIVIDSAFTLKQEPDNWNAQYINFYNKKPDPYTMRMGVDLKPQHDSFLVAMWHANPYFFDKHYSCMSPHALINLVYKFIMSYKRMSEVPPNSAVNNLPIIATYFKIMIQINDVNDPGDSYAVLGTPAPAYTLTISKKNGDYNSYLL